VSVVRATYYFARFMRYMSHIMYYNAILANVVAVATHVFENQIHVIRCVIFITVSVVCVAW